MKTWIITLSFGLLACVLGCQETSAPGPSTKIGSSLTFYSKNVGDNANDGGVDIVISCHFSTSDAIVIAEVIEDGVWQHECPDGVLQDYREHMGARVKVLEHISGNQIPSELFVHFSQPDLEYRAGEVILMGVIVDNDKFLVGTRVNVDVDGSSTDQEQVGESQTFVDLPITLDGLRSKMNEVLDSPCPVPTQANQAEFIEMMRTHHRYACNGSGPIEDDGQP